MFNFKYLFTSIYTCIFILKSQIVFGFVHVNQLELQINGKQNSYQSGKALCKSNKNLVKNEFSYRVPIVKYNFSNDPTNNWDSIYAYTLKPFRSDLPTVIFFSGGPGASGRSLPFDLPEINIVFFDQRGIACSRPDAETDFNNPGYYSSQNTAFDGLAIVNYLKLEKVTVFGHSYGTVSATIFASLFPERTRHLVLEGVLEDAGRPLFRSKRKQELLQIFFESLEDSIQNRIIQLSNETLPSNWFSKVGGAMMYLNDGLGAFQRYLNVILKLPENELKQAISYFYTDFKEDDLMIFSSKVMRMITCQETLATLYDLSATMTFNESRKLIYETQNPWADRHCKPEGFIRPPSHTFLATRYPVEVPVFYFLGETDGATDLDHGLRHYQQVAKGEKHLFILSEGGHLPSLSYIRDNRFCDPAKSPDGCASLRSNQLQVEILSSIIRRGIVNLAKYNEFNEISEFKWSYQTQIFIQEEHKSLHGSLIKANALVKQ